ncbi:hypothetical protein, partial [Corynebacterium glyciniphilum]|uniref:hypothetical protein n=1 Tax=Corynebacterium glyciniphilum TaxID=1404244 RepID=UPI001C92F0DE
ACGDEVWKEGRVEVRGGNNDRMGGDICGEEVVGRLLEVVLQEEDHIEVMRVERVLEVWNNGGE